MLGMRMELSHRITQRQEMLIKQLQLITDDSSSETVFPVTELYLETEEGRVALAAFGAAYPDGCIPNTREECRSVMDAICANILPSSRKAMRRYYAGNGKQLRFECTAEDIEACDMYLLEVFKELYVESKLFDLLGGSYHERVPRFVTAAAKKLIARFRKEAPPMQPRKGRKDSYYETLQKVVGC